MAKVKAGKGTRAGKTKTLAKLKPKAKSKRPAQASAKAKAVTRAQPKRSVGSKAAPSRAAAKPRAKPALLAPDVATMVLFDLICSVEDTIETGLTFGICEQKARDHNGANPGHDAQPIRRQ